MRGETANIHVATIKIGNDLIVQACPDCAGLSKLIKEIVGKDAKRPSISLVCHRGVEHSIASQRKARTAPASSCQNIALPRIAAVEDYTVTIIQRMVIRTEQRELRFRRAREAITGLAVFKAGSKSWRCNRSYKIRDRRGEF